MKTYKVVRADFPLFIQDNVLSTGMTAELQETEEVLYLVEQGILEEQPAKKSKKEDKDAG